MRRANGSGGGAPGNETDTTSSAKEACVQMPRRGKRAAASKKNGALGGRSSGRAEGHPTADAPQGAAARVAPSKKEAGRPRNKPSAVPLVRRGPDRICLDDGRALLTGDSPHDRPPEQLVLDGRIASRREEKAAARARANLVCCCPLCFLCLLLSDDNQKLAFINAVHSKRNREGTSSNCSRRTKKARQQHQQRQHLC